MRGVWRRSHGQATKAPPDERGGQPICSTYSHRATLLLYDAKPTAGVDLKRSSRIAPLDVAALGTAAVHGVVFARQQSPSRDARTRFAEDPPADEGLGVMGLD